jgi:hypothetical protein
MPTPPTPPKGYNLKGAPDPTPPTGYSVSNNDDMFEAPADVTAEGTPYFIPRAETKVVPVTETLANGTPATAYVKHNDSNTINVQQPAGYNAPTAAHEETHIFQNSRNAGFRKNLAAKLPQGTQNASDYDYGGVEGLKKNHTNVGDLNAEQQASIVGDLTKGNMMLRKGMTQDELAQWDDTKRTLGHIIEQLKRIPADPSQNTPTAKADVALSVATGGKTPYGILSHLKDFLYPPKIDTRPMPSEDAPSTALGYALPSRYVRGGSPTN